MFPVKNHVACIDIFCSCRAVSGYLDGEGSNRPRTMNITEALINSFDVPELWDDHGIISNVVVSFSTFLIRFWAQYF
jgi:hypothetical protein